MTCICAVCKQPVEMALAVKLENHVVHPDIAKNLQAGII